MEFIHPTSAEEIPNQYEIPWSVAFQVSWAGVKRRLFRSAITMLGVVLAIALLTYMLVMRNITAALVDANLNDLNLLLQKQGVDIFSIGRIDTMTLLLIALALLTCLVGIVNSMMMSVTERIKEIGTLKCLGALNGFIVRSYFIESALQGCFGTLLGIVFGLAIAILAAGFHYGGYVLQFFPKLPVAGSVLLTAFIGLLMAIAASIAPAYWAAKKDPVDAMREDE